MKDVVIIIRKTRKKITLFSFNIKKVKPKNSTLIEAKKFKNPKDFGVKSQDCMLIFKQFFFMYFDSNVVNLKAYSNLLIGNKMYSRVNIFLVDKYWEHSFSFTKIGVRHYKL